MEGGRGPRGGEARQRDRELVEEAVRWNRETAASERESREEIADSRGEGEGRGAKAGGGINKVEETGVRHVGGDGRQRIPTGSPPRQTRPLFCPGAAAESWDAALFPYHTHIPVWSRPSRSTGRQSVTGRRTGTTHTVIKPGRLFSTGELFFFIRATEGPSPK